MGKGGGDGREGEGIGAGKGGEDGRVGEVIREEGEVAPPSKIPGSAPAICPITEIR